LLYNYDMKTNRLIIEKININDKIGYFNCISHDKEVLKTFMSRYEDDINDFDFDRILKIEDIYSIKLKENNEFIGVILICDKDELNKSCEIGYALGSNYWNHGYMSETCKCFIDFIFNNFDYDKIIASHFIGNEKSRNVMLKCGMKYSYTIKDEFEYLGEMKTLDYYELKRSDYLLINNA